MTVSGGLNVRRSLSDAVFDRIQRAIKSGAYAVDERLPTEHALAAEFQVSRPVVRDALQRLRDQGLIYSRRGAGSFVREQACGSRSASGRWRSSPISSIATTSA